VENIGTTADVVSKHADVDLLGTKQEVQVTADVQKELNPDVSIAHTQNGEN